MFSLMTAASAADLGARPYTKAPPLSPAYNWSGFYIGAMGGYAFDSDNGGGFGGGTIGYNWQAPGSQFALGSVTGRVGVAADAVLFYAKGGYAWANNELSASGIVNGSDSHVHSGYTVGGGIEYMFAPNWSAKAEYMFTHLGSENYNVAGIGFDSGTAEFSSVKVGINYHFK